MRKATLKINRKALAIALANDLNYEIIEGEAIFGSDGADRNARELVKADFMPHMESASEESEKPLVEVIEEHLLDEWYINMGYYVEKSLKVDAPSYKDRFLYMLDFYADENDLTGRVPKNELPEGWKPREVSEEAKERIRKILNSSSWKNSAAGW